MIKRIVCVVALFVLAGCATRQDAPNSGSAASADGSSSSADSVVAEPSAVVSAALLAAEKMSSTEPSVYFDYDKYEIQERYNDTISAFGEYLRTHPDKVLVIEGNCDERGTIEYNLALGQKRADAVRAALAVVGVDDERIETISNGEEKPRNIMKSGAGYSVNRRADILIR